MTLKVAVFNFSYREHHHKVVEYAFSTIKQTEHYDAPAYDNSTLLSAVLPGDGVLLQDTAHQLLVVGMERLNVLLHAETRQQTFSLISAQLGFKIETDA